MEYNPITVTDLNKYIKSKIDSDEMLNNVLVKGEISNFKNHYTGHMYFTLKDENSLIKCVMFKTYTTHLSFMPKDGMKVIILGSVSVFERDGVYQVYAKAMKQDGLGSLYEAYEKLKAKLSEEGLFDESHKKKIPFMPKTIGVLTSNTGAVIRDIINVSTRRNPNVHIRLYAVPVQGAGAAEKIAEGIEFMNKNNLADVLIIGRGGGSLEDLWPFNEEIVARAIYNSKIPIISAVGHETDFTICDFVADMRAPTPSAAAEIATPNLVDLEYKLDNIKDRLNRSVINQVNLDKNRIDYVFEKIGNYLKLYTIKDKITQIDKIYDKINFEIENTISIESERLKNTGIILHNLSPLATLDRGYSIVHKEGEIINSIKQIDGVDIVEGTYETDGKLEIDNKNIEPELEKLLNIEEALAIEKEKLDELTKEAIEELKIYNEKAEFLVELAKYIKERNK